MKTRMTRRGRGGTPVRACICVLTLLVATTCSVSADEKPSVPVIVDGETQEVPRLKDPDLWIRQDLWVETEFDSDGDDKPDRMHVGVTRPRQTDTEGLKVPVIYESSPYYAGSAHPVHIHLGHEA